MVPRQQEVNSSQCLTSSSKAPSPDALAGLPELGGRDGHEAANRPARPSSVMLSAMASCGIRTYLHGFPPCLLACSLACLHHFTATSRFARTASSLISFFALGSSM